MKRLTVVCAVVLLTGCSGAQTRNKWQKSEDFVQRRSIYYNNFVESGGMVKDETSEQSNQVKQEIQNAVNQGRTINHIG